jgi:beta-glucosidase
MILNWRDFAVFDPGTGEWVVESGDFDILVGASSRDIRMQDSITVRSDQKISAEYAEQIPDIYRKFPLDADISREDFERLLGRKVRQNKPAKKGEYTINTPILEMQGSLIGRVIKNTMDKQIGKIITGFEGTPMALMMEKMIEEAPLRMMLMAGGEKITMPVLEAILMMANGRWIRGLAALMKQRRKK